MTTLKHNPGSPLVEVKNATVRFGNFYALRRVNFCLHPGQHWVIMGPNGAGKSTLLRLIAGELRLEAPATSLQEAFEEPGSCFWGFDGKLEPHALAARQNVRMVSPREQEKYVRQGWKISGLEVILSSLDNTVMLYGQVPQKEVQAARKLAALVGAHDLLDLPVPAMSQGQLRLILLLRAIFAKPRLLLLDEPFDGLDAWARTSLLSLIREAVRQGVTIVCTAHREKDIPPQAAHGLLMEEGRARVMTSGELAGATAGTLSFEGDADSGATGIALGDVWSREAHPASSDSVPVLCLRNVDVYIERTRVLHGVNWTVRPGEQWVVTGSNGSGKSTLMRLLYGEEFAADGGQFAWFGRERTPLDELHTMVGYVADRLQQTYSYDLIGFELVLSGFRGHIGLYGEPSPEERRVACGLIQLLGLGGLENRRLSILSSGLRRRFFLARALAGNPRVLLLDEPCSGLDDASRKQFLAVLPVLAENGVQMIYVSHHPEDVPSLFDHELNLFEGRVAYSGPRRV